MLSLRNKTYLILISTTLLFFMVVYGIVWYRTEIGLKTMQRTQAEDQLDLVVRIFDNELENLSLKQADWARWDDTYEFIADRNQDYIDSNLNAESLKLINVNLMVFVNNSGEIIYSQHVYPNHPERPAIPEKFMSYFQGESDLLDFDDLSPVKNGILTTPEAMLLLSAQPITTSDGKGGRRGTLIFGRYADAEYAHTLSELSGLSVQILPYGQTPVADGESGSKLLDPISPKAIEYVEDKVVALRLIDNIFGNPSLLLRIEYPSKLIAEGVSLLWGGLWYAVFALVTYAGILIVVIDLVLIRQIENMRRVVRQVSALQSSELPDGDIDDFSYLASVMMGAVKDTQHSKSLAQDSQSELEKFRMALEHSFDHMIITDSEGIILYANDAAEQLTGFTREEMMGKTPALWGRQMEPSFYKKLWETIRLHKDIFEGEIMNKNKAGQRYRAFVRVVPILDEKKRILYFIGIERRIDPVK